MLAFKPARGTGWPPSSLRVLPAWRRWVASVCAFTALTFAFQDLDQHGRRATGLLLAQRNCLLEHGRIEGLRLAGIAAAFGQERFKAMLAIGPQIAPQAGQETRVRFEWGMT